MNFSLFAGRVIVDAGNFTSAIFYSMASVNLTDKSTVHRFFIANALMGNDTNKDPYFGVRSIATGLAIFVDPQRLYNIKDFNETLKGKVKTVDKNGKPTTNQAGNAIKEAKVMFDIVFIFVAVLFSKVLVQGAFMMISRTIYIIKYLVLSPMYFAQYFLPGGDKELTQ